ncbi:hypothetical protein [Phenylobacterium sp.]|uniref:hypothetical protein n=1 Tax=Phenylobacterium sp. TaxID=1871053 RepID=UPI00121CA235|nr:hypothetical protein [Phenylobacterium sp.]THD64341.1 MAG: hypothetical protein E8A49_02320 [Phenylobacterium sp.]
MQVGSSAGMSPQLQALGSAALNKYQSGGDFSFTVDDGGGDQLSGNTQSGSLIAVGTISPNGQMDPFSPAQVQSEENMVANMGQASFADSLQNFLTLAQAGSPNGQVAASSYSDQQQFTGDNGLVSAYFNTSFSLDPAGGGEPGSSPTSTQSIKV